MNLAAVQKAPLVVIIENNQWAYSTPVSHQVPVRDLADRARAYGIASAIVDGNDVLSRGAGTRGRRAGARRRRPRADRGQDHAHDRPRAARRRRVRAARNVRGMEGARSLERYEKYLDRNSACGTSKTKAELDARVERELAEDLAFAESSPVPSAELAEQGVYCEGCHTIEAGLATAEGGTDAAEIERRRHGRRDFGDSAADRGPTSTGTRPEITVPQSPISKPFARRSLEEMERDPAVVLLGEDIGVYGGAFQALPRACSNASAGSA